MRAACGESDLANEALASQRVGDVGAQHLDGHVAVVSQLPGPVDRSMPPAPICVSTV